MKRNPFPFQAVVIIGAGRSGTNMLRDLLVSFPGAGTWPCDEINYIWRHGNRVFPTDEFPAELARPAVQRFIRGKFMRLAARGPFSIVVEKTCANSLRVPFVDAVLPEAKLIVLVRDGRDVAASAAKRWRAPLDIPYLAAKARWVPLTDLPFYAAGYARNRLSRFRSAEKRLSVWGPRFENMHGLAARHATAELAALQWQRCVELTDAALEGIDPARWRKFTYEAITAEPLAAARELAEFLGVEPDEILLREASGKISSRSVGGWRKHLPDPAAVERLIAPTLRAQGYLLAT